MRQVRSWINRWSPQVTVVAILLLGLAFYIVVTTGREPALGGPMAMYYYDLNTGKLFTAMSSEIPPIDAPSGPTADGGRAGVRAFVYSCGDCTDPDQRRIGWLEKYTPAARAQAMAMRDWVPGEPQPMNEVGLPEMHDGAAPRTSPRGRHAEPRENGDVAQPEAMLPEGEGDDPGYDHPQDVVANGQLVRRVDSDVWYPALSEEGVAIMEITAEDCGEGEYYRVCLPDAP